MLSKNCSSRSPVCGFTRATFHPDIPRKADRGHFFEKYFTGVILKKHRVRRISVRASLTGILRYVQDDNNLFLFPNTAFF